MTTTQYIGARYVPVFADPAEWNNTRTYEPLTIVIHNGNSYTSAQYVPKGIDISNEEFWKLTCNYNAQVEQYRKEVSTYDGRITANADAIVTEKNRAVAAEKVNADAIVTEKNRAVAVEKVNADAITTEKNRAVAAEEVNADAIKLIKKTPGIEKNVIVILGDSWTAGTQGTYTSITSAFKSNPALDGYTFKHYGESGAGFVWQSMYKKLTFNDQLDQFINDTTVDKSKVAGILLIGGCNDVYHAVDKTELDTAIINLFKRIIDLKLYVKWFPNYSAPGCIWNIRVVPKVAGGLTMQPSSFYPYLYNCKGGSFSDSRHLTEAAGIILGNTLAVNFFTNYMPPVIPRYTTYLKLLSFDDKTGTASIRQDFYDSKELVINITYTTIKETTDPILASLAGTPFALPCSDSPEYLESYADTVMGVTADAVLTHSDNTTDVMTAYNDENGYLHLSDTPTAAYKRVSLRFHGIDSLTGLA